MYVTAGLVFFALAQAETHVDNYVQNLPEREEQFGRRLKSCPKPGESFKCEFEGKLFPAGGQSEMEWPNALRLLMYLLALGYMFLGIAIISDIFMAAIEKVTSWKKRVKDKETGRTVTLYVWNSTVANLTLMALGSSAPEIMLSIVEITTDGMFLGDLGAGTIVGSAAFNLLVISAVCVLAIPEGEVRYIKQTTVYAVTATWSVFAYVWLMFILMVSSPNVCELWEALLTLLMCPVLVVMAFLADKGYFEKAKSPEAEVISQQTIPDDVTRDEMAMIEQQIRETHGKDLTSEQVLQIMCRQYFTKRSRAYYRQMAMKRMIGSSGGRKSESKSRLSTMFPPDLFVTRAVDTSDCVEREREGKEVTIGFECARYAFLESIGHAVVYVNRTGRLDCKASVEYSTRDGTAVVVEDYQAASGALVFESGEERKSISIEIMNDNAYEENEEFYIDLCNPSVEDFPGGHAKLSDVNIVTVVIIDDDVPGLLKWKTEEVEVVERTEGLVAELEVERIGGASGKISCKYETEDMSAIAGMDYEQVSGRVELGPSVQSAIIEVPIKAKGRYEKAASFIVRLTEAKGCIFDKDTDGGEDCCICHVTIKGNTDEKQTHMLRKMSSRINTQQAILGHRHYRQQFYDAFFSVIEGDDDDDDDDADPREPSKFDYFMHIVSLPWKVLFAFIPPTDYCGGWCCFVISLCGIAIVTAMVGDLANLVGCCLRIDPEITAITFVALGTSLPDTFASKTAACEDPYADASIGNITGSNSVNVFIGLGLSWTMAAIYWELGEPTQDWTDRVFSPGGKYYDVREDVQNTMRGSNGVFVVPRGTLWFNLLVFSLNALFAIQHLFARRKRCGGELGGPLWGFMGQYFSACFLVFQWVIYIGASSAWVVAQDKDDC